jgi:hypothetical protein
MVSAPSTESKPASNAANLLTLLRRRPRLLAELCAAGYSAGGLKDLDTELREHGLALVLTFRALKKGAWN